MCRLLGFWSTTPRTFPEFIGQSWTFVELSEHHPDGWDLTWTDEAEKLHSMRVPEAAHRSLALFEAMDPIHRKVI